MWVLGDLADGDRRNGMGTVVEYAGRGGSHRLRRVVAPVRAKAR
ncbi:hypothetical protein [Streptomyces cyslabdanicus]